MSRSNSTGVLSFIHQVNAATGTFTLRWTSTRLMSYAECYDQENVIAGETSLTEIIFIDSKCYLLAYLKHPSDLAGAFSFYIISFDLVIICCDAIMSDW